MHSLEKKQGYCNCDREVEQTMPSVCPRSKRKAIQTAMQRQKNKKSGLLCGLLIFAPRRAKKVQSLPLTTAAFSSPENGNGHLLRRRLL